MGNLSELFKNVLRLLEPRLETYALHPATVQKDNGDGTLDVKPDNPKIPALVAVPAFSGLAGAKTRVGQGSRVLVAFLGANPNAPVVLEYYDVILEQIKFGNATRGAAREGDTVKVTIPIGAVQIAPNTPNPTPIELTGTITSASQKVLVE